VNQIQSAEGKEFYIIDLPAKVFYPESEEYRKFRIGAYRKVPVYLKQPNQEKPIPGLLDTLSIGGISVYLSGESTALPYLRKGEKLSCSIMVDGANVKFEIVVENVKRLGDDKSLRVDCGFGNISKEATAVIKAMMGEAEQYLRNRARSS
jgi:predicted polyphosphate/ATP-dependent NAD kinase